jgi:uncharacterized protein (DUF427 family)
MSATRETPGPGQESVWDYPRPPAAEVVDRHVQVIFGGRTIADSLRPVKVMETSHPPVYYIPLADIEAGVLFDNTRRTFCEFKGEARYYDVKVGGHEAHQAAWYYPTPSPGYESLLDTVAFYPGSMDSCLVDGERATPQPGSFYGGWITSDVVGPFKGAEGTFGW